MVEERQNGLVTARDGVIIAGKAFTEKRSEYAWNPFGNREKGSWLPI